MSRWGKNMVVPLDSLCKEKEYTNRPTVARSVGTVGKWGKMGFTSTRTYSLSGLPAAVAAAAAAAAAAASPSQSPASAAMDDDMSPSVPEPPKPKKFFKSRNAAPPELIAQIIQHLPQAPTSPIGGEYGNTAITCTPNTPVHPGREPIKLKLPKSNSAEKKKKSPKKLAKSAKVRGVENANEDGTETPIAASVPTAKPLAEPKPKKKKEEKKLKPEAPPSRIISRARKAVNYCEDDDDERRSTPYKEVITPRESVSVMSQPALPPPPPAAPMPNASVSSIAPVANSVMQSICAKAPEHPPIVLRISKGTSRLVSTDSEEQPTNTLTSPPQQHEANEIQATPSEAPHPEESDGECDDEDTEAYVPLPPKIIVKPPKPPSPQPPTSTNTSSLNEPNEINYCTVKISPDKPPKERLKLIIKTGVIRSAMAAEAAMASNATGEKLLNESLGRGDGSETQRPEREKKSKSKKHKHPKHATIEQLTPAQQASVTGSEFKTPSPHLALGALSSEQQSVAARTIISPPAMSERDFDSQSSVLGSISSKGNSTPSQPLAQAVQEESCVIHSRGSSVITSDLETSQHSSLVAPPSDIESRLESMMMDGEVSQRAIHLAEEEPLQEDILAVLRGDESQMAAVAVAASAALDVKLNGITLEAKEETRNEPETEAVVFEAMEHDDEADVEAEEEAIKRRVTRGRGRNVATTKSNSVDAVETASDVSQVPKVTARTTRGRKTVAVTSAPTTPSKQNVVAEEETTPAAINRRATRRAGKKSNTEETTATIPVMVSQDLEEIAIENNNSSGAISPSHNKSSEEENNMNTPAQTAVQSTRRGRSTRNAANLNHNNINNNNINKIAANLSAKAGAAEEAKCNANTGTITTSAVVTPPQRSYGRKRKNQQVMQVLQPSAEELEEQHQHQPTPAKLANMDKTTEAGQTAATSDEAAGGVNSHGRSNSSAGTSSLTSPPRRDYKVKDKFKRTLTLDPQVNCNPIVAAATSSDAAGENAEEGEQRGSVKLVISKKKGSIFKSRTLGPTDQSEQSTAAAKRRLYKHRWDAEANGVACDDEVGDTLRDTKEAPNATTRTGADNVFDDFGDEMGATGTIVANTRDNSPAIGKFTRVIKTNPQAAPNSYDMDALPSSEAVSSLKIDRKAKEYYTVVRNVKTAHQIQEIGEYQEMDDDVEYILDALQPHNPTPTRCLSALQLATKCMTPAFRMHVRAHGVVTKFFKALSDANTDLSLGLCTSAIMYILSQEGLNMDLDRDSLELMMNLLESEGVAAPSDRANYDRNKQKVRELCEEIKAQGKATHLNVESITVGTLAMETLLSLTSKRAGEWFKEELRELGGLEHIIKTISDCCSPVLDGNNGTTPATTVAKLDWTQPLLENMQTVARCMRVLENVTQVNEENQKYMLTFSKGAAVNTLCTLYRLCDRELMLYPTTESSSKDNPGVVLRELLIPLMKVLINLTHAFNPASAMGAELLGQRADIFDISFHLLLQAPNYIPDRCIFELSMLVSLLLINLSMHTMANRMRIMRANAPIEFGRKSVNSEQQQPKTAVQAIMEYFYKCEEMARSVEKNTDAILDNTNKNKKKQEEVEETVNNLIQKAGHHMEHTLKGSYVAILIGYLITNSEENETVVRRYLHSNGFKEIVSVLEKYYTFMNLTASSEAAVVAHIKSTKGIIDYFKKRDLVYEMNEEDDCLLPLNLETHPHGDSAGVSSSAHVSSSFTAHNSNLSTDGASTYFSPSIAAYSSDVPATASASTSAAANATATATRNNMQRVYKTYSQR